MAFLASFWLLFLLDSVIVLFSFTVFVCTWVTTFFACCLGLIIGYKFVFFTWDFISSKYIDMYWFILGSFFILGLLVRLCLLLYFGSLNFVNFDLCKCIGFQWYWVYFIFGDSSIFSNILLESDYFVGDLRLLQCNNILLLLSLVLYKFWLSAVDVIHSFTIACLGVKVDCIPGRCNELTIFSSVNGTFYGQCSELCGVLHGFMPITITFI